MSDQVHAICAELINNGDYVRSELRHCVSRSSERLAAGVVAALVGSDHAKACLRERTYLLVPAIPELGKTMEQDNHRPVLRAGRHRVQANNAIPEPWLFKSYFVAHARMIAPLFHTRSRKGDSSRTFPREQRCPAQGATGVGLAGNFVDIYLLICVAVRMP